MHGSACRYVCLDLLGFFTFRLFAFVVLGLILLLNRPERKFMTHYNLIVDFLVPFLQMLLSAT